VGGTPAARLNARMSEMTTRRLGAGGPAVAAIGLGCIGMTGFYGPVDEAEALRTLHRALDLGCTFWDSSDAYGPHTNELLLSRVLRTRRDETFVTTKFGVTIDPRTLARSVDGRPEHVRRSCEASLRRLGVDHIDLYYQHRVDPAVPIEETVGAMAELVRDGKVRHLGLSEPGAATVRRAHAVHPLAAVQVEYSLWSRDPERDLLPVLRELGIALVAYAPIGHGFLSGRVRCRDDLAAVDFRRGQPRFAEDNLRANLDLLARVEEIAAERGATPAQVAIAWTLHRGPDVIPVPGSSRVAHLEENLAAAQLQLGDADLDRLERLPAARGERYDPGGMRAVGL
jgi:aryl-alcohol dehydrogenase-like predicted oxidoreductase